MGKWEQEFFWDDKAPVVSVHACSAHNACTANKGISAEGSKEQHCQTEQHVFVHPYRTHMFTVHLLWHESRLGHGRPP